MEILKENYRDFEIKRFVYLGPAPSAAPVESETVEAPKVKTESTEDLAEADVSGKIKEKETAVKKQIKTIRDSYAEKTHEDAANQFADKMEKHTETKFLKLQQDYIEQADEIGRSTFETSDEYNELVEEADIFKSKMLKRLGHAKQLIQFEHEQDEAENITDKKEKREALDTAKANLVDSYLQKKFPNMNASARKLISKLVVSELGIGFDGDLDKGSTNSYIDAIDDFMEEINEEIGKGKEVDDALIQGFLDQMPSPEATEEEKDVFRKILLDRPEIKNIGTESEHLEKVLTALATQFDVRPKDGNPKYFIDITTNKVYGVEAISNKVKGIDKALNAVLNKMRTQDATNTYQENLDKKTKELRRYRKDLDTGWAGPYGGEIDDWDEWEGHKGVDYLIVLNDKIQTQVSEITEVQDQQELFETDKAQETAREAAYQNAIVEADFYENHLTVEGYNITDNPDENSLIDTVTLSQEGGGTSAVITLDCTGTPKVTVKIKGTNYTETHEYSPKEFRDIKGDKLKTLIEEPETNLRENQVKVRSIGVKMGTLNDELQTATKNREGGKISLDLDSIQPAVTDVQTLIKKDITATMPVKVGEQVVGNVKINLATFDTTKIDSAPVTINSFGREAEATIETLSQKIQNTAETMQQEAKRAEGNKTEINTQVDADITSIETVKGMTVEKMGEFEGNLANPASDISVIQIKKDNELVATVQVKAGTPAEEGTTATPRQYVVIHQNPEMENKTCANAAELKTHLETNTDNITPKPKPYSEDSPDVPVQLDSARQGAKDNLVKVMVKLYPDLVPEELKEGGAGLSALPKLESAINAFVNGLDATRLGELQAENALDSFKPTKTERANLVAAIKEAYGHDESLKSSSEKEMKLINSLTVTINGQEKTFSEVFGENLAHIVSMRCKTAKRSSDKKQVIKLEGDKNSAYVELTVENIKQFLPEEMQEAYQEILDGGDATEFKKIAEAEKLTMENFQKLQEMLSDPEKLDAFKKMGFFEFFATLSEIFSMMQEAFKTKDFSTLHDVLIDVQQGKKPGEGLKSAKEAYKEKIDREDSVTNLLKYYHDPNGKEANALFMDEGKRIPYRTSVRDIIRNKFESTLGITIDTNGIEQLPGGNQTKITALKGEQHLEITIEANRVTMKEIKVKESKTIRKPIVENEQFQGLKSAEGNSLVDVLDFRSPTADQITVKPERESKARLVTEEVDENADTAPIKKGSVLDSANGFTTVEEDGTITIGKIGENRIHDVLDINNVESAVIVTKKGRKVTVTQGSVTEKGKEIQTFYFEKNRTKRRMKLYGGEKIKSTTLKKKSE